MREREDKSARRAAVCFVIDARALGALFLAMSFAVAAVPVVCLLGFIGFTVSAHRARRTA
ncbi:hypothetical protein [Streptomyces sp. NPDC051994]|uniref:hypothetical protein n=1 Tax=unclassified Streptomyces TaxID=2593676 RepID=UPI0034176630